MTPTFPRLKPNFARHRGSRTLARSTRPPATARFDGALPGALPGQLTPTATCARCGTTNRKTRGADYHWCHGPAGTPRLWIRLWQVTGDTAWLEWAKKSARRAGIPAHEPGFWNNVGQCCGHAGVAEFMLELHRVTKSPEYLAFARTMTAHLVSKATRDAAGARWVHAENRREPGKVAAQTGWMQGAAGIGAWLLRLDAFEQGTPTTLVRLPDSPY
jgi:lantibiotic modifying enzyme